MYNTCTLHVLYVWATVKAHIQSAECCPAEGPEDAGHQQTPPQAVQGTDEASGGCASEDVDVQLLTEVDGECVGLWEPAKHEEEGEEQNEICTQRINHVIDV